MVETIKYINGNIIYKNKNGEFHREDDGPAVIWADGTQLWYKNGKIHREDGPAMIFSNGDQYWFLNDTPYTFKEWCELVNISDELKMELVLEYG